MQTLSAPSRNAFVVPVDAPLARLESLMRCVLETEPCESSPVFGEFQRAVRTSAAELRDRGCMPEQMVIALKRATCRGALRATTTRADDLHYRMILWGILEYFRCDL